MKITLNELGSREVQQLIIESIDRSLYIARAVIDEETLLVVDGEGRTLKTRNLPDMKHLLSGITAEGRVLRHQSAYDEMIGHEGSGLDNSVEIPIAADAQPLPDWEH